jgi:hypothetical protein
MAAEAVFERAANPVGAELARESGLPVSACVGRHDAIASKLTPTGEWLRTLDFERGANPVGAELARESGLEVDAFAARHDAIASKLTPTGEWLWTQYLDVAQIPQELSLLAKAVCQLVYVLDDTTPSRAGSLPQGNGCGHSIWTWRKSCRS